VAPVTESLRVFLGQTAEECSDAEAKERDMLAQACFQRSPLLHLPRGAGKMAGAQISCG